MQHTRESPSGQAEQPSVQKAVSGSPAGWARHRRSARSAVPGGASMCAQASAAAAARTLRIDARGSAIASAAERRDAALPDPPECVEGEPAGGRRRLAPEREELAVAARLVVRDRLWLDHLLVRQRERTRRALCRPGEVDAGLAVAQVTVSLQQAGETVGGEHGPDARRVALVHLVAADQELNG